MIHLPKKAPYLNPNERKVNQQIKSDVCANRFYKHIEEQKTAVSEYLDKGFGRWNDDILYDTWLISGPVTVTHKDGQHDGGIPATILFIDKSTINVSLDPSKVNHHFGNTPILGTITKEQFFKSVTEVIRITQQPPKSMIIG
jgi:hypothetical protein